MRLFLLAAIAGAMAMAQTTSKENEVRDRGQTRAERPPLSESPAKTGQWTGTLMDAGCRYLDTVARSAKSGVRQPEQQAIKGSRQRAARARKGATQGSKGVQVESETVQSERSDITPQQTPDAVARQPDAACSITAQTAAFALVLPDGRFLDLDEGGNTKALAAFQATRLGQDVLSGRVAGAKPQATVRGRLRGATIFVEQIRM